MYDIYKELKRFNPKRHYLDRYLRFIKHIKLSGKGKIKHHILPKSMYPEYENLSENSWNCLLVTEREHFVCHMILYLMFRNQPMTSTFFIMSGRNRMSSRMYESLRKAHTDTVKITTGKAQRALVESGNHHFLDPEYIQYRKEKREEFKKSDRWEAFTDNLRQKSSKNMIERVKSDNHPLILAIQKGTNFTNTEEIRKKKSQKIKQKCMRPEVSKIKQYIKKFKIKLPRNWHLKDDDVIQETMKNLEAQYGELFE